MLKRTISAIILLPLFFIIIKGGLPLYVSAVIVSFIALKEFYEAFEQAEMKIPKNICYASIGVFFICNVYKLPIVYINAMFFALIFLLSIRCILAKNTINEMLVSFLGVVYIPFFLNHVILMIDSLYGDYVWIAFVCAWATDTFAYFSGYFFGKRKLIPSVSPKKTVEGSIGGTVGCIAVSLLFGYLFELQYVHVIIMGFFGSVFGQIGDLFASVLKRHIGIKDYSNLIPGHGGMLDRFDSILFTAPFVYYYVNIFIK